MECDLGTKCSPYNVSIFYHELRRNEKEKCLEKFITGNK